MKLKCYPALFMLPVLGVLLSCGNKKNDTIVVRQVNVKVLSLDVKKVSDQEISYSGTVKESKTIALAFQISGNITSMNVDKGQQVKKGQLLATVDETTYRNQYNAQLAQQKLAQDNYNRINEVFKKGSIAEVKLVEAKSQRDQAASVAKATYQNIVHTKLFAPTDGYIGEKMAEAGDLAAPGSPIVKLVTLEQVNIVVPVPESEINGIKIGQLASIKIGALNNRMFNGKIDEVSVVSEDASHNYNVKVKVPNQDGQLKPGMVANVYFLGLTAKQSKEASVITIPLIALQVDEQNRYFVYLVDKNGQKAVRRQVRQGELMNDVVVITQGLAPEDRVIVSGYQKITSGTPVKIIK